jgi:hypothetical protein
MWQYLNNKMSKNVIRKENIIFATNDVSDSDTMDDGMINNIFESKDFKEYYKNIIDNFDINDLKFTDENVKKYYNLLNVYKTEKYSKIICYIDKINNKWKKDVSRHIGTYDTIEDKLKYCSRKDIIELNKNALLPPIAYYDINKDSIVFINGRNRFANMRDMGAVKMPIWISKSDKKVFEQFVEFNLKIICDKYKHNIFKLIHRYFHFFPNLLKHF